MDVNQGKETGLTELYKVEQYDKGDYSLHLMGHIGRPSFVERHPIVLAKETEKGLLHLILQGIHFRQKTNWSKDTKTAEVKLVKLRMLLGKRFLKPFFKLN